MQKYPISSKKILDEIVNSSRQQWARTQLSGYQTIYNNLQKSVIGQELAIKELASELHYQTTQTKNKVYLFVGPTGVGKTELAKAVAKIKKHFIPFAMNLYPEEQHISTFFGAASGLVGSMDRPHFAKEMEKCQPVHTANEGSTRIYEVQEAVILFDEFEKAHTKIKQSLLTLFDEGYCTVYYTDGAYGPNISEKYIFKKSIMVATSNLYQEAIAEAFLREETAEKISDTFSELNRVLPLPTSYSPELLARMKIIPFGPIPRGVPYKKLLRLKINAFLDSLREELNPKAAAIENESSALFHLENKLYRKGVDIRTVNRYFNDLIKSIKSKQNLGDLKQQKLLFCADENGVFMKSLYYLDRIDDYYDSNTITRLP
jgi:ATP-dependent Clp protease ATP-binding subunit ClpA